MIGMYMFTLKLEDLYTLVTNMTTKRLNYKRLQYANFNANALTLTQLEPFLITSRSCC